MSTTSNSTPNVLATRYATKEMVAIFDPINKIIAERRFWITILRLQKKAGLPITDSDIASYEKVINNVDLVSIERREKQSRHDVKARIEEFNDLPVNAREYVKFLEKVSGAPISAIGVGPGRDETIVVRDLIK